METRAKLPVFPVPHGLAPMQEWRLRVEGCVTTPLALDLDALRALPVRALNADFVCEEGWSVPDLGWGGVALRSVLDQAGVQPEARYLAVGSGEFVAVLPLDAITEAEPLIAYALDGAPLTREHGGPLRLVASDTACYQSVKWVDRLELTATPPEDTAQRIAKARLIQR